MGVSECSFLREWWSVRKSFVGGVYEFINYLCVEPKLEFNLKSRFNHALNPMRP